MMIAMFESAALRNRHSLILGIVTGAVIGVFYRVIIRLASPTVLDGVAVMTLAFLTVAPAAIGFITVRTIERTRPARLWEAIVMPWASMLLSCLFVYLLSMEGLICVVMALPITCVFSSIGGLSAWATSAKRARSLKLQMVCVAVLPIFIVPIESRVQPPLQNRIVHT